MSPIHNAQDSQACIFKMAYLAPLQEKIYTSANHKLFGSLSIDNCVLPIKEPMPQSL